MTDTKQPANANSPRELQPYAEYHIPRLPTDVATRRLIGWFRRQFKKPEEAQPFIAESELVQATGETLENVAPPPGCAPLLRDLDEHFQTLICEDNNGPRLHLLLLPPGDRNDVLGCWAKEQGLDVLQPPKRQQLLDVASQINVQERDSRFQEQGSEERSDSQPVLMIPKLEDWFLRHERGLSCIRQLLDRLDHSQRRIIIGCNTWAWDFLCKATQAGLILPSPLTFQSFGATELRDWFQSLEEDAPIDWQFRLSSNGVNLFADDAKKNHYFNGLAAESLGIPWVAWHRWRKSLRYERPKNGKAKQTDQPDQSASKESDERTLWVVNLPTLSLSQNHFEQATLVLHALLIHGGLTLDELRTVVPIVGELRVVSALIQSGFIRRSDSVLQIVPTAYPEIRRELIAAGFPHPAL